MLSPPPIPKEWPPEVVETYEPVKVLGRGGFASVILAKTKNTTPAAYHAIKVVGTADATRQQLGYAMREIDILAELDHSNIMRLIHHWEPVNSRMCAAVMALSYSEGKTLEWLLKLRGRLGVTCARVVSAQLVEAVSYLHRKAVVHRDIAPSNIIVTGASEEDNAIWDDRIVDGLDAEDWKALRTKWHVTLVDFGFARALTPDDLKKGPPKSENGLDSSTGSARLNRSVSKLLTRRMSALGTRQYAAPEILNSIHSKKDDSYRGDLSMHPIDVTKTLSEHVSFYGLMADAFSVGNTMKHVLTGVSPEKNVDEVIALQNNPFAVLCRLLCGGKSSTSDQRHRVMYRAVRDIPPEAFRLIKGMTHFDPQRRTSVRTARLYPWIDDVLEGHLSSDASQTIEFLSFTLKKEPPTIVTEQDGEDEENATDTG